MSVQKAEAPIIIIKKKRGGHGHHGGAWKVAYADFVTAMMALFIVLWLMNSSEQVKEAVAGYFKDPSGTGTSTGSSMAGSGNGVEIGRDDMNKLKEKLAEAMKEVPALSQLKDQVEMTVTGEGLRVELLEKEGGTFFETGNAHPSVVGTEMLELLAGEVGKLPSRVFIEGHTDSRPYSNGGPYSNWELSSDRANAARRLMTENGIRVDQVSEVRGYADQRLRKADDPTSASNRRVSIVVQWAAGRPAPKDAREAAKGDGGHGAPAGHEPAKHEPAKPAMQGGHDAAKAIPAPAKPATSGGHEAAKAIPAAAQPAAPKAKTEPAKQSGH
jgi:chemotaxis protein MotB